MVWGVAMSDVMIGLLTASNFVRFLIAFVQSFYATSSFFRLPLTISLRKLFQMGLLATKRVSLL